jgi:hypothetical protein
MFFKFDDLEYRWLLSETAAILCRLGACIHVCNERLTIPHITSGIAGISLSVLVATNYDIAMHRTEATLSDLCAAIAEKNGHLVVAVADCNRFPAMRLVRSLVGDSPYAHVWPISSHY